MKKDTVVHSAFITHVTALRPGYWPGDKANRKFNFKTGEKKINSFLVYPAKFLSTISQYQSTVNKACFKCPVHYIPSIITHV